MKAVIFVGDARCYHTMDWYRSTKKLCSLHEVLFATDLVESEAQKRIVVDDDNIVELANIDFLMFSSQSAMGNKWRNLIKLVFAPLQVFYLKRLLKKHPSYIAQAHSMYYVFLCWMAGAEFVGTAQGSDILVRPQRSKLYKYFAARSLASAKHVTVDSENMAKAVIELSGRKAIVIQDGIDTAKTLESASTAPRSRIISIRGISPIYRIVEIIQARDRCSQKYDLEFICPLWEEEYRNKVRNTAAQGDAFLGRLERQEMYELLSSSLLAISIPISDSSPRTVYEAIFCGCCVAATYNNYIEALPKCMRSRIFIVDLDDQAWMEKAIEFASKVTQEPYVPSEAALETFDQNRSTQRLVSTLYGLDV